MRHPDLPGGREIVVDDGAVPHYAAAGWQPVPNAEVQTRERAARLAVMAAVAAERATAEAAEAEDQESAQEPAETTTAKRRTTKEK